MNQRAMEKAIYGYLANHLNASTLDEMRAWALPELEAPTKVEWLRFGNAIGKVLNILNRKSI